MNNSSGIGKLIFIIIAIAVAVYLFSGDSSKNEQPKVNQQQAQTNSSTYIYVPSNRNNTVARTNCYRCNDTGRCSNCSGLGDCTFVYALTHPCVNGKIYVGGNTLSCSACYGRGYCPKCEGTGRCPYCNR